MIKLRIKYISPSLADVIKPADCWWVGCCLSRDPGSAGLIVAVIDFQGKIRPTIDFTAYSWCEKADHSDYGLPAGRGLFVSLAGSNWTSVSLRSSSWMAHDPILTSRCWLSLKPQWKSLKQFPLQSAPLFSCYDKMREQRLLKTALKARLGTQEVTASLANAKRASLQLYQSCVFHVKRTLKMPAKPSLSVYQEISMVISECDRQ